jgi:hypothetical protein
MWAAPAPGIKMEERQKFRRVRGAPAGSMNRSEFATVVGSNRLTLRNWESEKRLIPRYVFGTGQRTGRSYCRPYYVPEDIQAFRDKRFWKSGAGSRLARQLTKTGTRVGI